MACVCYFGMQACFYNQRYICFAVDSGQWVLYDDQTAKVTNKIQKAALITEYYFMIFTSCDLLVFLQVVGDWIQVLMMCEEKEMQPLVLFFEGAN
jgi:hypothetical protein